MLITVEGIDGAGKTTLVSGLAAALGDVEVLREPGGVELSERLRALVKDPALTVGARAEALIYAAARAQLVEERLRPLLASGRRVLLDRFVDSSLAYQGAGRGPRDRRGARSSTRSPPAAWRPTGRCCCASTPPLALERMRRGEDRIEQEREAFWTACARAYDELAAAEPERWVVLDATQPPEALLQAALAALP